MRVSDHALHLRIKGSGDMKLSSFGDAEQFVVGHRTPQEIGEPGSEFHVGKAGNHPGFGVLLDAEQEVGGDQHRSDGELEALGRCVSRGLSPIKSLQQRRDIGGCDRATIGPVRESREDSIDARSAGRGVADQNFLLGRVRFGRRVRSGDFEGVGEEIAVCVEPGLTGKGLTFLVIQKFGAKNVVPRR